MALRGKMVVWLGVAVVACSGEGGGDQAGNEGSASITAGSTGAATTSASQGPSSSPSESDSASGVTSDSTSAGPGSAEGTEATTSDDGPKFDLGMQADVEGNCGGRGGGSVEFSYIWIANSSQNAVSKINTETMVEEGRYLVHPGAGNPSRTSVSLSGDVAVANRAGGITKIHARVEDCQESNGTPGIQTATDANFLPWGEEECIAWHTPMAYTTQRPVAWSPGTFDPPSCTYVGQEVWTAAAQSGQANSVVVTVLDGDTGAVEAEVPIPEIAIGFYGPYGAAFDTNGDFWFVDAGNDGATQELVRVRSDDLSYDIWMTPSISPYGFTVDTQGRPWIAGYGGGVARFDPVTEQFDVNTDITGLGIQEDGEGRMWMAHYPWSYEGVIAIDRETMQVVTQIDLPSNLAKGVSIDFFGNVWVVDQGTSAFRIDPDTQTIDTFTGLVGPYTYSDMTGWGLNSVTNPEG